VNKVQFIEHDAVVEVASLAAIKPNFVAVLGGVVNDFGV
jgi:hypothetical protein